MDQSQRRTYRLPRSAYFVVLFLIFGVTALVLHPVFAVLYLLPVLAAVFIARVGTDADERGLHIRALFGSRLLAWDRIRGLSVGGRNVYAVTGDGTFRLPCVRINDLPSIARTSGGRLPELAEPRPKYAPSPRRRR